MTREETFAALKKHYDGYHFAEKCVDIYNPFSLLNAFNDQRLRNYWFESGTPTFLVKMLKNEAEYNSAVGRADAVVITKTTVYVFEFKMSGNGTAEDALQQIDDKKYMLPFTASGKNLVKIGVEFSGDKDERNVARWVVG